jgi:hypothetical protein
MKKMKKLTKVISALLIVTIISLSTIPGTAKIEQATPLSSEHRIDILKMRGGFGITIVAKNNGDQDETNVSWEMTFTGSRMMKGRTVDGYCGDIKAGETFKFINRDSRGFGITDLTMKICFNQTYTCFEGSAILIYCLIFIRG